MSKTFEFLVVAVYNLALLAGASYLYIEKDVSGWIFALAIVFGASWKSRKEEE